MAVKDLKLFNTEGFKAKLPDKYLGYATSGSGSYISDNHSKYTTEENWSKSGTMIATAYAPMIAVLDEYTKLLNGVESRLAIGTYETPDGVCYISEFRYLDDVEKEIATYREGVFKCAKYDSRGVYTSVSYKDADINIKGCAMIGAILPLLIEDEEAANLLAAALSCKDDEQRLDYFTTICDNAYRRCGKEGDSQIKGVPEEAIIPVNIGSNVRPLVESVLASVEIDIINGEFTIGATTSKGKKEKKKP